MLNDLPEKFSNPGSLYRGKPFWAWNGKLDPEELRRQIRIMHHMGLGGFFMHSRVGLDTEYLGKEWFECVEACLDESKKLGMEAWMYDEDRWPSGAAGGLVTKNPEYRMRHLVCAIESNAKNISWSKDTVAVFAAKINGITLSNVRNIKKGDKPSLAKGEKLLIFVAMTQEPTSWYNGKTYLDTMNKDAVKEFIRVTHVEYAKQNGKEFGKVIPGIFTDEPNHGSYMPKCNMGSDGGYTIPWTPTLPKEFKKSYGYDIINRLPEVFFDVEGVDGAQVRYHYHDCTTALFVNAFSRQIGDWCGKNNLYSTGHMLSEDTLSGQSNVVGSCMRHYEYMQAPGMDILTERWRIYAVAKQVSSVARQCGRMWRLTETYGCTGWDFPFLGHKALGDWQAALGINIRCQHLSWYTMQGEAKRDYPAGIFYQSPWWESYSKVEDYFARITSVMTRGEEIRDALLIHPVESCWIKLTAGEWGKRKDVIELNQDFFAATDRLLADNIDFDYGDEEMLSRLSSVSTEKGVPVLRVGKAVYRSIIVPHMDTMRPSTLKMLKNFRKAGGQVVFCGKIPEMLDALPSDEISKFARECEKTNLAKLADTVSENCRRLSIADEKGKEIEPTLYMLREDKDAAYVFICNVGHNFAKTKNIQIMDEEMARDRNLSFKKAFVRGFAGFEGKPLEFNTETGEYCEANASREGENWVIRTDFPALGSRLFVVPRKSGKLKAKPVLPMKQKSKRSLGSKFSFSLSEDNSLALDWPEFRINGGKVKSNEILKIDHEVRNALGLPNRGGQMVQPWVVGKKANPKSVEVELKYSFSVKSIPSGALHLAVENPETFKIFLNGNPINTDVECGWWCDRSLRKISLDPGMLAIGDNELVMVCSYDENHSGLEIVYLLGNFGVSLKNGTQMELAKPADSLKIGDWGKQGLTFYGGSVSYLTQTKVNLGKGQKAIVKVDKYRGTAIKVIVNGKDAGVMAWEPNEIDITDYVKNGESNLINIQVLGSRRNSHGPFHMKEKWPSWTGPGQYADVQGKDYNLVPCGLLSAPSLVIME